MARTLLVIDDDEDVRTAMQHVLEGEGYVVEIAADGVEACEKLATIGQVDVIVLDLHMPRMDAVAFRRWQVHSPHAHLPVILFTTTRGLPTELTDGELRVAKTFSKPFDVNAFMQALEAMFER